MFKIQIQLILMMLFLFYFHIGCKKLPLSQVLKLFDSACCQDNIKDNVILSLTLWLLSIKIELLYFLFLIIFFPSSSSSSSLYIPMFYCLKDPLSIRGLYWPTNQNWLIPATVHTSLITNDHSTYLPPCLDKLLSFTDLFKLLQHRFGRD